MFNLSVKLHLEWKDSKIPSAFRAVKKSKNRVKNEEKAWFQSRACNLTMRYSTQKQINKNFKTLLRGRSKNTGLNFVELLSSVCAVFVFSKNGS